MLVEQENGLKRCCRSTPRCRTCPVLLATEVREVNRFPAPETGLPPHLAGVPACLHRYEPLLRRAWEQRERAARP